MGDTMLVLKEFNPKKIILTDGEKDYVLEATGDNEFIEDIIESILDYGKDI